LSPGHSRYQLLAPQRQHQDWFRRHQSPSPGKRGSKCHQQGQTFIDAQNSRAFVPANSFGVEYLTYVLWAITPQGRPVNLGEVMPGGSKAEMNVTTNLQQFALIITANLTLL